VKSALARKGSAAAELSVVSRRRGRFMSVLRQMYSWAMEESVLKRQNNPASKIQKNLPKKKPGEIVLTLREARIVWQAAKDCGYPFGTHAQLMMLKRLPLG